MKPSEFERCASRVFGNKWRQELPLYYKVTPRAMRYWLSGECGIPNNVKTDLLAWTGEHGGQHRFMSIVEQAYQAANLSSPEDELRCLDGLRMWNEKRTAIAVNLQRLARRDAILRAEEIMLEEHDDDVFQDDRTFKWFVVGRTVGQTI